MTSHQRCYELPASALIAWLQRKYPVMIKPHDDLPEHRGTLHWKWLKARELRRYREDNL